MEEDLAALLRLPFGGVSRKLYPAAGKAEAPSEQIELNPRFAPENAVFVCVLGHVVMKHRSSFQIPKTAASEAPTTKKSAYVAAKKTANTSILIAASLPRTSR